jgi:hypothetical protein
MIPLVPGVHAENTDSVPIFNWEFGESGLHIAQISTTKPLSDVMRFEQFHKNSVRTLTLVCETLTLTLISICQNPFSNVGRIFLSEVMGLEFTRQCTGNVFIIDSRENPGLRDSGHENSNHI